MKKHTLSKYTLSQDRVNYLKFLLIGDNFDVSELLRHKASDWGMDVLYDACTHIVVAGIYYDELNEYYNTMSEYDSFCKFLDAYDVPIRQYIGGEDIDLIEIVRRDFNE